MYTNEINRNKSNTYIQMRTAFTPDDKSKRIDKIGGAITSSIQILKQLKVSIMSSQIKNLPSYISSFKSEYKHFQQLQKDLMDTEETTLSYKLKNKVKQFLVQFKPQEIQAKLQQLKNIRLQSQRIHQSQYIPLSLGNQQSQIQVDRQALRKKLLEQQLIEIKTIEKMMNEINRIAIDHSKIIYQQGVQLGIGLESIKSARKKLQDGRTQLIEANQYQQDTNKKKLFFCILIIVIVTVILLIMYASHK